MPDVILAGKIDSIGRMTEGEQPTAVATPTRSVAAVCAALYESAQAGRYGLSLAAFQTVLLEAAAKYVPSASEAALIDFLKTLRVEELALARGCASGNEAAWQEFMGRYRSSLYGAAYAIAKDESVGRELADDLYAELYGLPKLSGERASKLRYYMGRGSLEGWLRTVLAQEFVNRYRRMKHDVSLEEKVEAGAQFSASPQPTPTSDSRVDDAVSGALRELPAEERLMLSAYYLDGRKLAEIARLLGVHESTISRKLDRATTALRKEIRKRLIAGGMSDRAAQEALEDADVRDLSVDVRAGLQQESPPAAFYKSQKEKETS